jgi:4-diphosphocytidyl-2-C-methyl-D-erythritol kinase
MEEPAHAKINLALHVRGREPDGFHRIETVFAFAEAGDAVRVAEGEVIRLFLAGPFAGDVPGGGDNLVLRAARALAEVWGVSEGAALTLDKRLPVASGLGGGSADAAATLRLLTRWWRLPAAEDDLLTLARPLGADVAACLLSRTVRGEGRGDRLAAVDGAGLRGTPLLLVNPGTAVSTAEVFGRWRGGDGGPLPPSCLAGRNDLLPAAVETLPVIAAVLEALEAAQGSTHRGLSGSGATCFALFESEPLRDAARARIAAARPDWWQLASRLR